MASARGRVLPGAQAAAGGLAESIGVQEIVPVFGLFGLFERNAVGIGVLIVPDAGDLPVDFAPRLAGNAELVAAHFGQYVGREGHQHCGIGIS